jgi:hypothetical protein
MTTDELIERLAENEERSALALEALGTRLGKIEANLGLAIEGLRLVCQELGIRERLGEIRDTLKAPAQPAEVTNGE